MRTSIVKLYRSPSGWRWRVRDKFNRKILAASTEAYHNRAEACMNYKRMTGFDLYPGLVKSRLRCFAWLREEHDSKLAGVSSWFIHKPLAHSEALKW